MRRVLPLLLYEAGSSIVVVLWGGSFHSCFMRRVLQLLFYEAAPSIVRLWSGPFHCCFMRRVLPLVFYEAYHSIVFLLLFFFYKAGPTIVVYEVCPSIVFNLNLFMCHRCLMRRVLPLLFYKTGPSIVVLWGGSFHCSFNVFKGTGYIRITFYHWLTQLWLITLLPSLIARQLVSYVAFVLSLFVPHLSFFWCLGKAVLRKFDIFLFDIFFHLLILFLFAFLHPMFFMKRCLT